MLRRCRNPLIALLLCLLGFASLGVGTAAAQMNNRPWTFGGGSGGLGMSDAYRQAILLDKLQGFPRGAVLLRTPSGLLATVERVDQQAFARLALPIYLRAGSPTLISSGMPAMQFGFIGTEALYTGGLGFAFAEGLSLAGYSFGTPLLGPWSGYSIDAWVGLLNQMAAIPEP